MTTKILCYVFYANLNVMVERDSSFGFGPGASEPLSAALTIVKLSEAVNVSVRFCICSIEISIAGTTIFPSEGLGLLTGAQNIFLTPGFCFAFVFLMEDCMR